MAAPSDQPAVEDTLDPVFLHARREAIFILLLFAVSLVWSVGLCYWQGYEGGEPANAPEIAKGPAFATAVGLLIYPQVAEMEQFDSGDMPLAMTGTVRLTVVVWPDTRIAPDTGPPSRV